jgi:hypothetical protein
MTLGKQIGSNQIGAGNAQAAGITGAANAWSGALKGALGAAGSTLGGSNSLGSLLQGLFSGGGNVAQTGDFASGVQAATPVAYGPYIGAPS